MSIELVNTERLMLRLEQLGQIGVHLGGGRTRLALTLAEGQGRDLIVEWLREAGAAIHVDKVGNIFGVLAGSSKGAPVMTGSHIDTVTRAGALDGCYGVVAGIEVLDTIRRMGIPPRRTLIVAAFTNEEGVRFTPDLMGSRVMTKAMGVGEALNALSADGARFGAELEAIGYSGTDEPWAFLPGSFIELHIEQGPILDHTGIPIGIVEGVQGYSWWEVTILGQANHAGTTPMSMRLDSGIAAFEVICKLTDFVRADGRGSVVTAGTLALNPNAINVIASKATFSLDIRDADDTARATVEAELRRLLESICETGFDHTLECVAKNPAVKFDKGICSFIERSASDLAIPTTRMVSGASHDAQMVARVCPTAMIFVPSHKGISHNPEEHTEPKNLALGAQVLMATIQQMIASES